MRKDIIKNDWYEKLLVDLRKLEFTGIVLTKWNQGKRILEDELKFQKPEYGSKRIENIAKDLNVSSREIYRCLQFVKQYPKIDTVCQSLSWRQVIKQLQESRSKPETPELPEGKFQVIYADPPWEYWGGGYKNQSQHYDVMNYKEIMDIPIQDIAADNCILFLWATSPAFPQALELLEAWGFKYSTIGFVWVKSKKDKTGFAFGCGYWTRANAEYCLIATKGHIERKDAGISQIIYEPKEEHSKKPDIVREKIVQLVGELPRIELFARGKAPKGWENWGNEALK